MKNDELYNPKTRKQDYYIYETSEGEICIEFKNGIFNFVAYHFTNPYTRNQWKILAAIEKKISELEEKYLFAPGFATSVIPQKTP